MRLRSSPSYEPTILRHLQQSVVLEHHDMNGDWVMVSVVLSDLRLGKLDVGCTESISLPSLGGSRVHSVKVGFELSPTGSVSENFGHDFRSRSRLGLAQ